MRLREKPREYHAIQWTGDNYPEMAEFCDGRVKMVTSGALQIETGSVAVKGDWVLKNHSGALHVELPSEVPGWRYEEI